MHEYLEAHWEDEFDTERGFTVSRRQHGALEVRRIVDTITVSRINGLREGSLIKRVGNTNLSANHDIPAIIDIFNRPVLSLPV